MSTSSTLSAQLAKQAFLQTMTESELALKRLIDTARVLVDSAHTEVVRSVKKAVDNQEHLRYNEVYFSWLRGRADSILFVFDAYALGYDSEFIAEITVKIEEIRYLTGDYVREHCKY